MFDTFGPIRICSMAVEDMKKYTLLVFIWQFAAGTTTPPPSFDDVPNKNASTLSSVKPLLTSLKLLEITSTQQHDVTKSTTDKLFSTCAQLRERFHGVSNDLIEQIVLNNMETTREACILLFICRLQRSQENKCGVYVDGIGTCYFPTKSGETASTSCPASISGIAYDISKNVTRYCDVNGTWEARSNYSECKPLNMDSMCSTFQEDSQDQEIDVEACKSHLYNLRIISYVGRGLALFTLVIAFVLFWILRSIRCWRNIIHWNLVASFILRNIFWILLHLFISYQSRQSNAVFCRILVTIFNYTQATNYFWMFVEGLYLHMMVVLAYSYDRIKLGVYLAIGWGLPVPLTLLWAILKYKKEDTMCWMPNKDLEKMVDYFLQIPIIIILLVNAIILGNVVRILFTKLRAGYVSGGITGEAAQYTKAVKAAVFLFPLLGVTYVIFFVSPPAESSGEIVFLYFNTFMQSFQGFFVCLIYCFANNEIQRALMKKVNSWKWQINFPCCFWQKREIGMNRRASSVSLSRTNNTLVTLRIRDTREGRNSIAKWDRDSDPMTSPNNHEEMVGIDDVSLTPPRLNQSEGDGKETNRFNMNSAAVDIEASDQPLVGFNSTSDSVL
uniref:corticotropin-releasing factor receptor 2-like isoform X1 n=2 Tax=Styela clava TaxID=7725 RepID=UPI0019393419|nr:corticotropin-releasing factor receptor 2-like isoform X1 [Styela clava]